jgi:hypothetical protein
MGKNRELRLRTRFPDELSWMDILKFSLAKYGFSIDEYPIEAGRELSRVCIGGVIPKMLRIEYNHIR